MEHKIVVDTDISGSLKVSVEGELAGEAPRAKQSKLSSNYNLIDMHSMRREYYRCEN